MKGLLAMFRLTAREQRLVVFVVLALVLVVSIKHRREKRLGEQPTLRYGDLTLPGEASPAPNK